MPRMGAVSTAADGCLAEQKKNKKQKKRWWPLLLLSYGIARYRTGDLRFCCSAFRAFFGCGFAELSPPILDNLRSAPR